MESSSENSAILEDLTDAQKEAVCHGGGPLLVVAGAGSGKTRVIIRRIAYLLSRGVPGDAVIAVTFTNKAAQEMQRRVEALVGKGVWVSTFHSFCTRVLRKDISQLGWDPSFSIYDRRDSVRTVRRVIKSNDLDTDVYKPRRMLNRISHLKNQVLSPEQWQERAVGIEDRVLATVYEEYQEELRRNNALDFDDLLLKSITLFREHPHVLQLYQDRFRHVLIDEYQDTNLPQHLIAQALQGKHHSITAVGDPDQMIYGWRGARLDNMLEFEDDFPGSKVVKLERNYRSTGNILRAASVCISHNLRRHEKVLWTDREPGEPVEVREHENAYEEADFVADRVEELLAEGVDPGKIAVFYRTKHQSLPLERSFSTLALPHQVVDSVGFFDRKEVKDLRAYLQLLVNPDDDEACLRIINTPRRGIGQKTQQRLTRQARASRESVLRTARRAEKLDVLGTRAIRAVKGFCELFGGISSLDCDRVENLIEQLVEKTDYLESCDQEDREDAVQTVDNLLGYARQYDERSPEGNLRGFLEEAALVSDVDGWNAGASAVPFMTLHSAKGLEFEVVFVTGVEDELLPHARALEEDEVGGGEDALEEERRLLHVGMTRARSILYLTYCRQRFTHGREETVSPSRFLEELPDDCIHRPSRHFTSATNSKKTAEEFKGDMDVVLEAKRRVEQEREKTPEGVLDPGQRVTHPMFGEGQVVTAEPEGKFQRVTIRFDTGGEMQLLLPRGSDTYS